MFRLASDTIEEANKNIEILISLLRNYTKNNSNKILSSLLIASKDISQWKKIDRNKLFGLRQKMALYLWQTTGERKELIKEIENLWFKGKTLDQQILNSEVHLNYGRIQFHFVNKNIGTEDIEIFKKHFKVAVDLMNQSKIPNIDKILYGDVYIEGNIDNHKDPYYAVYFFKEDFISIHFDTIKMLYHKINIHFLIHEFGHRYYAKILNNKQKKVLEEFYVKLKAGGGNKYVPKVGDSFFEVFHEPFKVNKVIVKPGDDIITNIEKEGKDTYFTIKYNNEFVKYKVPEADIALLNFPSLYASEDPEEFFSEMFAMFCTSKLRDNILPIMKEILYGRSFMERMVSFIKDIF